MIGYITLGTNDLEKAGTFYDELLAEMSAQRFVADDRVIIWGVAPGQPMFSVLTPYNKESAIVGNGTMVALKVDN